MIEPAGSLLSTPIQTIADIPRLTLPGALADCGGPSYPRAIRILSDQLGAKH